MTDTAAEVEQLGTAPSPAVVVRPPKLGGQYIITNIEAFAQAWGRIRRLEADGARQHATLGLLAVLRYDLLRWQTGIAPPELQSHRAFADAVGVSRKMLFGRTRAVNDGPVTTSVHEPGLLDVLTNAGLWDPGGWRMPSWHVLRGDRSGRNRPDGGFEAISVEEFHRHRAALRHHGARSWLPALGAFDRLRLVFREWDGWIPASNRELSRMLNVHRATLLRWSGQWEAAGLLVREPHSRYGTCWRVPRWRQLNAWEDPAARDDTTLDRLLERPLRSGSVTPLRQRDQPGDSEPHPQAEVYADADAHRHAVLEPQAEVATSDAAAVDPPATGGAVAAGPHSSGAGDADGPHTLAATDAVGPHTPVAAGPHGGAAGPRQVVAAGPHTGAAGPQDAAPGPHVDAVGPQQTRSDLRKRPPLDALAGADTHPRGLDRGELPATIPPPSPSAADLHASDARVTSQMGLPRDGPDMAVVDTTPVRAVWQQLVAPLAAHARTGPAPETATGRSLDAQVAAVLVVLEQLLQSVAASEHDHQVAAAGARQLHQVAALLRLLLPRLEEYGTAEVTARLAASLELDLPDDAAHLAVRLVARRRAAVRHLLPLPSERVEIATAEPQLTSASTVEEAASAAGSDTPAPGAPARARLRRWEQLAGCPIPQTLGGPAELLDDTAAAELVAQLMPLAPLHRRQVLRGERTLDAVDTSR